MFTNSDVPKWSLTKEWVEFAKMYFSSSRPKEYYIRSSYQFFKNNRESVFPRLQQDKNKARPENYTVMATEFDTDLTSRDVISADAITEVNQVDGVVMSSGEKGDTYDGVSDDFSQIVSSRGSNVPNADSNIGITCHDVLSSDVKYQSWSGGYGDLSEHHNQNVSISNTHSPTEVREDKNSSDNMSRGVSHGVLPNRMVEARLTNKYLVGYSDNSQNSSVQASTSAGLGEPTTTSFQNVNEIPHFYFPNVTSIENSLFIGNCNDAYVRDRVPKEKIVKVGTKDPSPSIAVSAGLSSSSSKFVESFQSFADKVLEEKSNVTIEPSTLNGRVHEHKDLNHEKCHLFSLDREVSIKLNDKTWDIIQKESI